ncbi:hypothetical protein TgHK011_009045 [Trichoderma gracile]|nr:hypothetical protein TgHK011_009045 [Trichoderma gracile]
MSLFVGWLPPATSDQRNPPVEGQRKRRKKIHAHLLSIRVERRPVCNGTGTTNNVTVDRPYEPSLGICFNARASLVACFAQIAEAGDTLENSLLMG